jgi:hypothetical protein
VRLRYTGPTPTTFAVLGIEAAPGDEFEIPEETAAAYLARADVEAVEAPKGRRRAKTDETADTETAGPAPETIKEGGRAVSDDH